jgi:hypothetical protein
MAKSKSQSRSGSRSRKSRRSRPSRIEIHTIQSNVGFTPKIPTTMRNRQDVAKLEKHLGQIKAMLIAITASWCGACHQISDKLNKALNDPKNVMPGYRLDYTSLPDLNKVMKTPVEASAYPELSITDNEGNVLFKPKSVEEADDFLKGRLPISSSASASNSMKTPEEKAAEEAEEEEIANQMASLSVPEDLPTLMKSAKSQSQPQSKSMNSIMKMESVNLPETQSTQSQTMIPGITKLPSTTMSTATPPVQSMDQINQKRKLSQIQAGGSLYASLASTAYQLAPPAVLLGIAAATLRKRRGRKGKKSRKSRKI